MMNRSATTPEDLPFSYFLKRGTLLGAALGLLAGLIYLGVIGVEADQETASIVIWRNFILAGALGGFLLGVLAGWQFRDRFPIGRDPNRAPESKNDKQQKP